jgi:hypothetical protein
MPPKPLSKTGAEALQILKGLKDNQVAKITPDGGGQTIRGLKASFSRVAKSQGFKVQSWEADSDPGVLFLRKTK